MAETHKFLTDSKYTGTYNNALHNMEGFGRYTFPDGSEYRGYFQRGKFHGFGRLYMALPKFTFTCEYDDGMLRRISSVQFPDGLILAAKIEGAGLNFDDWLYCTKKDRRFANEIAIGIEPVGPTANLTATRPAKELVPGTYDTGGGIFKSSTRFIIDIPPPFFRHKFVACDKEAEWIRANCRMGPRNYLDEHAAEPDLAVVEQIINTNVDGIHSVDPCSCRESASRKGYLLKLCRTERRRSKSDLDVESSDYKPRRSTDSVSSFEDVPIIEDVLEKCELEVHSLKINVSSNSDSSDDGLLDAEKKASIIAHLTPRNIDPAYKTLWDQ